MSDQMSTALNGKSNLIKNKSKNKKIELHGKQIAYKKAVINFKILISIFNRVEEERKIPKQWKEKTIKSIYKGWQKQNLGETQRGIFITNAIS